MGTQRFRNRYTLMSLIVVFGICLSVIYLHLLSHNKTQEIYLAQTEKTIIELKKDFIKDTVNNMFLEIDSLRETKYSNYEKNTQSRQKRFQREFDLTDEEFIAYFIDTFEGELNSNIWTGFLWNSETEEILYNTPNIKVETIEKTISDLQTSLSSHADIEKNNIKGMFGVSRTFIDDLVKDEIEDVIKNRKFSGDSYIWINEIISYEGGKDYAIRKVHPNLIYTEGEYLSTDMEDIKGNLPYLEELEGINKHGELFLNYYFKKLNSHEITEKITYAKLYKDYDWIIAMGIHLDDIDEYANEITEKIYYLTSESIIRLLRYIFLVLFVGMIMLYFIDKKRFFTSTKLLEMEVNIDTLTGAHSRRYGERCLTDYFKKYKLTSENVVIMAFDIDGFKGINDNYGHDVGDIVLKEIAATIGNSIGRYDQLIRWGGDEFICIFPGLKEQYLLGYGNTILGEVSNIEIPVGSETVGITISIGFSSFRDKDNDYNEVLKRADIAMYNSKQQGKNRVNIN